MRFLIGILFIISFGVSSKETSKKQLALEYFRKGNTFLFEKHNPESAMKYYTLSIEKDSNFADAYFNLGIARSKLKGYLGAIKHFKAALKINSKYAEAHLKIAEINFLLKKNKEAIDSSSQYVKLRPKDATGYYLRAKILKYRDEKKFILDINKAIELNPSYVDAYLLRGKYFLWKNKKYARVNFEKVIELDPKNIEGYLELATNYLNSYNDDDEENEKTIRTALAYADKAIQINSNDSSPYFVKAKIYEYRLDDIESAIKQCDKILEINPSDYTALRLRIDLKVKGKNYIGAKTDCLSLDEKDMDDWFQLGKVELLLNNNLLAETAFSKAIQIKDSIFDMVLRIVFYYERANVRFQLKNYSGALEDYNIIVNYFSEQKKISPVYRYERGVVRKVMKDYSGALEDFDSAVSGDSSKEYYFYERGRVKYLLKDYQGAYDDYTKAIELNLSLGIFYQARAYSLIQLNDLESARIDLLFASAYLPENIEIQKDLETLDFLRMIIY